MVRPLKKSAPLKSCVHHNEQNQKKGESSPSLNGESQTRYAGGVIGIAKLQASIRMNTVCAKPLTPDII